MKRLVQSELLDELPVHDPHAVRSRADLRRLNWLMRHVDIIRTTFESKLKRPPGVLVEIGAGDGTLMLKLAEQTYAAWPGVRVVLVDRQRIVSEKTRSRFRELGWHAEIVIADVFDWLASADPADAIIANLFLHHFSDGKLAELLRLIAARTNLFVACETRRDWPSLAVTHSLGLFGCNHVTRHDAVKSAQAGFVRNELSALWAGNSDWNLTERRAILFTHLFVAHRVVPRPPIQTHKPLEADHATELKVTHNIPDAVGEMSAASQ